MHSVVSGRIPPVERESVSYIISHPERESHPSFRNVTTACTWSRARGPQAPSAKSTGIAETSTGKRRKCLRYRGIRIPAPSETTAGLTAPSNRLHRATAAFVCVPRPGNFPLPRTNPEMSRKTTGTARVARGFQLGHGATSPGPQSKEETPSTPCGLRFRHGPTGHGAGTA